MTLYIARNKTAGTKSKPFSADEEWLRDLKNVAFRAGVDLTIEEYDPNARPSRRRSIVSHKSPAFIDKTK